MKLPTAVYTAHKGYAWSHVPDGITPADLDNFSRLVSMARGDFPDPISVSTGVVSDGRIAAAFSIQNVANWDANGRSADYGAFVFFPVVVARLIDFVDLINNDFFWTPSKTPATYLDYTGQPAEDLRDEALVPLKGNGFHVITNPRGIGSILTAFGKRAQHWVCLMQEDGTLRVECAKWTEDKEEQP